LDAIELAAVLVTVALLASIVSVELGVTVALIELTFGVIAGNVFDLQDVRPAELAHDLEVAAPKYFYGLQDGDRCRIASPHGSIELPIKITDGRCVLARLGPAR